MVRRHELTDEQWQVIESLLPPSGAKGRPRVDDRRVINGMLDKAKTGIAWRDLPERYGPWKTVCNRFWRWARNGTLTSLVKRTRVIATPLRQDRPVLPGHDRPSHPQDVALGTRSRSLSGRPVAGHLPGPHPQVQQR